MVHRKKEITIRVGTRKLLFDIHPNISKIETEDIYEYLTIYEAIGDKPGESNRIKNILSIKSNGEDLKKFFKEFNRKSKFIRQTKQSKIGEGLVNLNEKVMQNKAMKRLNVLSSAYKAGHTNVLTRNDINFR